MLDVVLILLLVLAAIVGYRHGLLRGVARLVGLVAGGLVAFLLLPSLTVAVHDNGMSSIVIPFAVFVALLLGSHLGSLIGLALQRGAGTIRIGLLDHVAGAIAHVAILGVLIAVIAASLTTLGNAQITLAVTNSRVVTGVNTTLPTGLRRSIAEWQSTLTASGLPRVIDTIDGITANPGLPDDQAETQAQTAASRSVVRISGIATACSSIKTGSGFVVSPNRVVTNAHVVAGVQEPVVESTAGSSTRGHVVFFNPRQDLAVIATDRLDAPTLALGASPRNGQTAAVQGFPYGGPFTSRTARVLGTSTVSVADIYGDGSYARRVQTLAAQVSPGNSGGPLLNAEGRVIGVVFARDRNMADVGYSLSDAELASVARSAPADTATVSTQSCRTAE